MRVLMTGATGSLGRSTIAYLRPQVDSLTVVARRPADLPPGVGLVRGDLTGESFVAALFGAARYDVVLHLAAALGPAAETPAGYLLNAAVPVWVAQHAARAGARRLVFASSMAVYAPFAGAHGHPEYAPVTEDYTKGPARLYGAAKLAAEEGCALVARQAGLEFAAVRFSPYYGPSKPTGGWAGLGALLSSALGAAAAGEPVVFPDWPGAKFDPIYAEDAARALALAVTAPRVPDGGAVHVSGEAPLSCADVVALIRRVVPSARVTLDAPERSTAQGRHACAVFNTARAREALGYGAAFTPEAAFRHFIDSRRLDSAV